MIRHARMLAAAFAIGGLLAAQAIATDVPSNPNVQVPAGVQHFEFSQGTPAQPGQYPLLTPSSPGLRAFGDQYNISYLWFATASGAGNYMSDPPPTPPAGAGACPTQTYNGVSEICGAHTLQAALGVATNIQIIETETNNGDGSFTITIQAANANGADMLPAGFTTGGNPINGVWIDFADTHAAGIGIPGSPLNPNIGVSPFNIFEGDAIFFTTGGAVAGTFALASEGTVATELKEDFTVGGAAGIPITAIQLRYRIGPDPTGACCLADDSCIGPVTAANCSGQGGVYQGNNSNCGSVTCVPQGEGACCAPAGTCTSETQSVCANVIGGRYKGDGTSCITEDCTGACCDGLTCTDNVTPEACAAPLNYLGDGSACSPGACNPPAIPTISEWGFIVLAVLVLGAGVIAVTRRNASAA